MRFSARATIITLSFISAQVIGLAIRPTETVSEESADLRGIARAYITELRVQNQAINQVEEQLYLGSERSSEKIAELCNALLESYYRLTEPRNRMAEITPGDAVIDTNSIEYLVAVAARYATNVMHIARKLRKGPVDENEAIEDIRTLRKEHSKAQLFDQILLELADISFGEDSIENVEELNVEATGEQSLMDHGEATGEDQAVSENQEPNEVVRSEPAKSAHDEEVEMVAMRIEEIHTTTTETIVKSYTEAGAVANWS